MHASDQKRAEDNIASILNQEPNLNTHPLHGKLEGYWATEFSRGHRVVHTPPRDGEIYIGYVGLHDYGEARQRLGSVPTYGKLARSSGTPVTQLREQLGWRGWTRFNHETLTPETKRALDRIQPDEDDEEWLSPEELADKRTMEVHQVQAPGQTHLDPTRPVHPYGARVPSEREDGGQHPVLIAHVPAHQVEVDGDFTNMRYTGAPVEPTGIRRAQDPPYRPILSEPDHPDLPHLGEPTIIAHKYTPDSYRANASWDTTNDALPEGYTSTLYHMGHFIGSHEFMHEVRNEQGQVVGRFSYSGRETGDGHLNKERPELGVHMLEVAPQERGKGLGHYFMDHLQDHARATGALIDHGVRTMDGHFWWKKYTKHANYDPSLHHSASYFPELMPPHLHEQESRWIREQEERDLPHKPWKKQAATTGWIQYYANEGTPRMASLPTYGRTAGFRAVNAPDTSETAPLHDIMNHPAHLSAAPEEREESHEVYREAYDKPEEWGLKDPAAQQIMRTVEGKPDHSVPIFHASPVGNANLREGDTVHLSADDAERHFNLFMPEGGWEIRRTEVPAKHLHVAADLTNLTYRGPDRQSELHEPESSRVEREEIKDKEVWNSLTWEQKKDRARSKRITPKGHDAYVNENSLRDRFPIEPYPDEAPEANASKTLWTPADRNQSAPGARTRYDQMADHLEQWSKSEGVPIPALYFHDGHYADGTKTGHSWFGSPAVKDGQGPAINVAPEHKGDYGVLLHEFAHYLQALRHPGVIADQHDHDTFGRQLMHMMRTYRSDGDAVADAYDQRAKADMTRGNDYFKASSLHTLPTYGRRTATGEREVGLKRTAARGVGVAGILIKALDTGRVLLLQRAFTDQSDPARGLWEMPGGHLEDGETPAEGAWREWMEETGAPKPRGAQLVGNWLSPNAYYQGFLYTVPRESSVQINLSRGDRKVVNPDQKAKDPVEAAAWWDLKHLTTDNPVLRKEFRATTDWALVKKATRTATAVPTYGKA